LQLGFVTYNQQQLLSIMQLRTRGNGLLSLAQQLIAAKLNVADGNDAHCIALTIAAADRLIGDLVVPPVGKGYLDPRDVSALVGALEDYNLGRSCAPACPGPTLPTGTHTPRSPVLRPR